MSDYNRNLRPYDENDENDEIFRPMTREEREARQTEQEQYSHTNEYMSSDEDLDRVRYQNTYSEDAYADKDPYVEAYRPNSYIDETNSGEYDNYHTNVNSVYDRSNSPAFSSESRINAEYEQDDKPANYFNFDSSEDYYDEDKWNDRDRDQGSLYSSDGYRPQFNDSKLERRNDEQGFGDFPYYENNMEDSHLTGAVSGTLGKVGDAVSRLTGRFKKVTDSDLSREENQTWTEAQTLINGSLDSCLIMLKSVFSANPIKYFGSSLRNLSKLAFVVPFVLFLLVRPFCNLFEKAASNRYYLEANPTATAPYKLGVSYGNAFIQGLVLLIFLYLLILAYKFLLDKKSLKTWDQSLNILAFALIPQIVVVPFFAISTYLTAALAEGFMLFANIATVFLMLGVIGNSESDDKVIPFISNYYLRLIVVLIFSFLLSFISRSTFIG